MEQLIARLGRLYSAVVADVLDDHGLRRQTLDPGLRALGSPEVMAGRAATLDVVAVDNIPDDRYRVQFEAVDALTDGCVMVVAAPLVSSAFWGELLTTRALVNGCVGAVVDGFTRDVAGIRQHPFGLWARGTHPADSAGRLNAVRHNQPIVCGGVTVNAGDYVVADADGVVVVPAGIADVVATDAERKATTEDKVRASLARGATVADTYAQYGVM